ncbi:MAG: NADH-quinone oxidoreductase subunit H [Acidobacteriota bacterium]
MSGLARAIGLGILNAGLVLLLAPLYEGIMRKLRAAIHSRIGPPVIQPYLDILKLLGKEDLRTAGGIVYGAAPALTLASTLVLAMLVPIGAAAPLYFAGDIVVVLYVAAMSAVLVMITGFASASPYASIGSSREMMMLFAVEPVLAVALITGAYKAGSLATSGIMDWQLQHGPSISMAVAAVALFLALQAQAGKLPFDIPEADQEIMGGTLIEQSGPRLALIRWAMWSKQLALAFLLVDVFIPWPHAGVFAVDLIIAMLKVLVVLILVALVDVVNPRLRIDQAMGFFMRVAFSSLAALAFAVIGM